MPQPNKLRGKLLEKNQNNDSKRCSKAENRMEKMQETN